ncbi:insulinase family protein, partial [candidate division WOR-3 bacterium]|nr:insulinase family protein [candidate division WOR-3 bacterium]
NEGLLTQSNVQYIAKGYNFRDLGFNWKGSMLVLKLILGTDYLWNRVRVVGGAYGAFTVLKMNGNVNLVSYRDPNLKETFKVYNETGNYIRNFTPTKREMDKFIIGTIGQIDRPLTPSMKGERATEYYLRKITYNDLLKEREEILDTKPEDIRRYAKLFDEIANNNYICVLGNEQVIKRNSNLFDNLVKVFE